MLECFLPLYNTLNIVLLRQNRLVNQAGAILGQHRQDRGTARPPSHPREATEDSLG